MCHCSRLRAFEDVVSGVFTRHFVTSYLPSKRLNYLKDLFTNLFVCAFMTPEYLSTLMCIGHMVDDWEISIFVFRYFLFISIYIYWHMYMCICLFRVQKYVFWVNTVLDNTCIWLKHVYVSIYISFLPAYDRICGIRLLYL